LGNVFFQLSLNAPKPIYCIVREIMPIGIAELLMKGMEDLARAIFAPFGYWHAIII
jgi:hypothetical protein